MAVYAIYLSNDHLIPDAPELIQHILVSVSTVMPAVGWED